MTSFAAHVAPATVPDSASGSAPDSAPDSAPHEISTRECNVVQHVLDIIGRRWAGAILVAGTRGARRFSEYRRLITGISDRMLSQRLKELESLGLVERHIVPSTPVQVLYQPSQRGEELVASLQPLITWGDRHLLPAP
ncbi:DNA-binding transcriptional regulator, HxlR family [Sinosporangium album]|uniref:DNA-binding transcriptional regulator, HxlR family n=1 Tax=Sinosporangium album TaxID=504805 RepID=A0A1G7Y3X4_9ACTN|nr:helix-turn-helix domain-containing protein [Sinosporangium album]SDG91172.1 DNA-binding transcriptional regulator, HxlR family [Sinosporangium album]